jgi:hypothetical protein
MAGHPNRQQLLPLLWDGGMVWWEKPGMTGQLLLRDGGMVWWKKPGMTGHPHEALRDEH